VAALRPEIMGLGPIPAIRAVLKAAGMTIEDIVAVEMNEAFAAQVVPCRDELGMRSRHRATSDLCFPLSGVCP
jgi:acetyl-CoA C-acetyltransferase